MLDNPNAFKNEPPTDFTIAHNRVTFSEALAEVATAIDQKKYEALPIVGGQRISCSETHQSLDPATPATSVGTVHYATREHALQAVELLEQGAAEWDAAGYEKRAELLCEIARRLRLERHTLSALIVREVGKPWAEADADVCEAIDFCDYYAAEMRRLGPPFKTQDIMGEINLYFYQPRGLSVVIAPWNFPLAIAAGMTVASLVAGNPTILKPAEQSSLIAARFAEIVLEAGVPENVFAFLPGNGELIGRELVQHPAVNLICFTGSKAVGLEIIKTAGNTREEQIGVKKVIAEMGGKNAVIIDEDADLDEAVKGVISSAFGFAGQKCSACSRVIAVGDCYEIFMKRLSDAAGDILVGKPEQPSTFLGPVIDEEAQKRILNTITEAEREHTLAFKGEQPKDGYFVPATVFRDVPTDSSLWQEEIFGPVVACRQVRSFDEALQEANGVKYALTGGIFSRSPGNIERARREFRVGNLYINRNCTGALVCRQPFGGFKMSGVGSKAGGPDYLLQFLEPRTITENTMRKGFSPDVG